MKMVALIGKPAAENNNSNNHYGRTQYKVKEKL
jgi:hypothetical protein